MYGFEAITYYNGWAMALTGILIVFSGLVVLATVISQLHKILFFFENRANPIKNKAAVKATADLKKIESGILGDLNIDQIINLYRPLADKLGESFELTRLYEISENSGLPHPHLSIKELRQAAVLLPRGDGIFSWNQPDPA